MQKAGVSVIKLVADNPIAIKALIAWFYGLECSWTGQISKKPFVVDFEVEGTAYAIYQANVYMAALKYLVPCLQTRALQEFNNALLRIRMLFGTPNSVGEVVRYVFLEFPDASLILRKPVVDFFIAHIERVTDDAFFEEFLQDVPELAVLIIKALAGGKAEAEKR